MMVVAVTVIQANSKSLESLLGLPIGRFSAAGAAETLDPSQIVESDVEQGLIVRLNRPIANIVRRSRDTNETKPVVFGDVNELGMRIYTVQAGDTVWGIATQNGLLPDTITWSNAELNTDSHLNIGDTLVIPPVDGAVHRIVSGDTLLAIAIRYEAEMAAIVNYSFNGLETQNTPLISGQELFIPGGTKPPPPPRSIQYTADGPLGEFKGTGRFRPAVSATLITQGFWPGHRAIDYAARLGTPIVAIDHGAVAHAHYGWNGGYGNMVVIDHGNGFTSLYAHLSAISVKVGDRVRQGQLIGTMGSTGKSTGSHLHLEIRLNGEQQNPLAYISE